MLFASTEVLSAALQPLSLVTGILTDHLPYLIADFARRE
jgi:hypothetical protein